MRTQNLTQRLQTTLEHLKQAQELGSKLPDYAEAFGLNVKDLYNGRAQLQRKGLWPKARKAPSCPPELLEVQVTGSAAAPADSWMYRLTGPGGWMLECRQLPDVGLAVSTISAAQRCPAWCEFDESIRQLFLAHRGQGLRPTDSTRSDRTWRDDPDADPRRLRVGVVFGAAHLEFDYKLWRRHSPLLSWR